MKIIDLVKPSVPTVHINDRISELSDNFLPADINSIPVVDDEGKIFGVITSATLAEYGMDNANPNADSAWETCCREFCVIHPDMTVTEAIQLIQQSDQTFAIVAEDERYIGMITTSSLLDMVHVTDEAEKSAEAAIDPKSQSNELEP